jgi:hypothetical protein
VVEPKQISGRRKQLVADAKAVGEAKVEEAKAAEEGAAKQAQLDQEAADRQQASADTQIAKAVAAAEAAANPKPAPEVLPEVSEPPPAPKVGMVWNGSEWVDPPKEAGDKA